MNKAVPDELEQLLRELRAKGRPIHSLRLPDGVGPISNLARWRYGCASNVTVTLPRPRAAASPLGLSTRPMRV